MSGAPWLLALTEWQGRIRLTGNHRYQVFNGKKWEYVDGTTSVIPKSEGAIRGLKKWAARCAEDEAVRRLRDWDIGMGDPADLISGCGEAHIEVLERASTEGTEQHAIFEREFRLMLGETVPPLPMTDDQLGNLLKFRAWVKEHNVRPVAVEARLYNTRLNHGGMLDLLAYYEDGLEPEVMDYKRNKYKKAGESTIYAERKLQSIAYRSALQSMLGLDHPFGGRMVYYGAEGHDLPIIDKLVDDDPDDLLRAFTAALEFYRAMKSVDRAAKKAAVEQPAA